MLGVDSDRLSIPIWMYEISGMRDFHQDVDNSYSNTPHWDTVSMFICTNKYSLYTLHPCTIDPVPCCLELPKETIG